MSQQPNPATTADPQPSQRKARDRSLALLLVGICAFLPPIAGVFRIDGTVFGVPFPLVYVFAVWTCLVGGAFWVNKTLRDDTLDMNPADERGGDT